MLTRDVVLVAIAYLAGSVPFGLLIARLKGNVDLRRVGSGNIGATNVLRAVGKGAAAVVLARGLGASSRVLAAVALAAVLGHLFPVFLGFRGGKGVATTLGVVLAAMPAVGGLLLLVWLLVAAVWRYSSLAALAAAAALPALVWLLDGRPVMVLLGALSAALIFWRHRENIERLRHGTEGKIGQKARPADTDGQ